jgi:hypothetical protein
MFTDSDNIESVRVLTQEELQALGYEDRKKWPKGRRPVAATYGPGAGQYAGESFVYWVGEESKG